ncbi:MAG: L-cysteate sulfo-lyase [Cellvibrionaceae bacterium]|jgi:L-cysteate sulfo-lyase
MVPNYPKRIPLAYLPTPIERMPRLSSLLKGSDLYIKRDDLTGLGGGGNKARKLEFLIAEAQAQGCDHIITVGGLQSNHCRQTAAAAARVGMGCSLVLRGNKPDLLTGNMFLNKLFGAHITWTEDENPAEVMNRVAAQQIKIGHTPYLIPLGGSNVVGTTAYVVAMEELAAQLKEQKLNIDVIVFASGSGGTQAGIVLGAHLFNIRAQLYGISVSRSAAELQAQVGALSTATAAHLGLDMVNLMDRIEVNDEYAEPGYGVLTAAEKEAIELVAEKEGILLDPVYTGRAMAGLIDLIRWGAFTRNQTILFWHTGGAQALHAYADKF